MDSHSRSPRQNGSAEPPVKTPHPPKVGSPKAAGSAHHVAANSAAHPTVELPKPSPPSNGGAAPVDAEREKRNAYLRRPLVAAVMDDLVSQCLANMPDDPATFILQHLEARTGVSGAQSMALSDNASTASGVAPSRPPPVADAAVPATERALPPPAEAAPAASAATGAAEELLQWLVANANFTGSKEGGGCPPPLPAAAAAHPLAADVQELQQRLQVDTEAATITSDELRDTDLAQSQRDALVRSVTRATQSLLAVGSNTSRVLQTLASALRDLVDADRCSVFMADERRRQLTTQLDGAEITLPFGRGIAGAVAASGKGMRIDKAYEDARFNPEVDLLVNYVTKSLLTLPMHVNGHLIAVVQLVNKRDGRGHFTDDDEQIINAFTKVAGVTIRSSMFFAETARISRQNEIIAKINAELANSDLHEAKLIPIVVRGAKEIVGADRCAFFKVEENGATIVAHLEGVHARMKLSTQDGIVGFVARHRELVNIVDAYKDKRFNGEVDRASGYKTESLLCFPIFAARELVGIAQLVNKTDPETGNIVPFDAVDEETVTAFGKVAGVCMRNCKLHEDLVMQQVRLEDVARIATHLSSSDSDFMKPRPILEFIAKVVCRSAVASRCLLYQVSDNDATPTLQLMAASDDHHRRGSGSNHGGGSDAGSMRGRGGHDDEEDSDEDSDAEHHMAESSPMSPTLRTPRGVSHPIGSGVVGAYAARARSNLVKAKDLADLELEVHLADGSIPDSVLVIPIIDTGMTIGCCVITDPSPEVAATVVAAGSVKRRSTIANLNHMSSSGIERSLSETKAKSKFSADISVGVSMAGFTMRMAHILDMSNRHGNNLAAIMEFEQAGVEPGNDDDESLEAAESVIASTATPRGVFAAVDETEVGQLDSLSFDIHKYRRGDAPVSRLIAYIRHMLVSLNLLEPLGINDTRLHRFLSAVRSKYRSVPYHNFFHAFDVTQTVYTLLRKAQLEAVLRPEEQFALIIACVCHDVDHMGLNNAFHLRAETPLGILTSVSGQKSVLEVHHCQIAMDLLARTRLLADTPREMRVRIQKIIINCILATDMAVHRDRTQEFEAELGGGAFDRENEQHRLHAMALLLKMADISNVVKAFDISRQWGIAVTEEFYQQGDRERRAGLEVTPMFDRERKVELAKGQIGFIKMLAAPFFKTAAHAFAAFQPLVDTAEANIGHWERVLESTRDA